MREEIYLAGGCFWGIEAYFKTIEGVVDTEVGYANGKTEDTFYENLKVSGHAETLKLSYDTEKISLEKILEYFYYIIDPFSINNQGHDFGTQYRTGVYTQDDKVLEKVKEFFGKKQEKEDKKIVVENEKLKNYIKAEEYHQDYLDKNPTGYCHINIEDKPEI